MGRETPDCRAGDGGVFVGAGILWDGGNPCKLRYAGLFARQYGHRERPSGVEGELWEGGVLVLGD